MKVLKVIFLIILLISSLIAQLAQSFNLDPYNPAYEPNVILVKFKDDASISKGLAKGVATTGISAIDQLNQTYQVESMEKVFKNSEPKLTKPSFKDPSGKVHKVPNLDKIYKLKYKADIDPKDVIKEYQSNPEVKYAEPDYHVYIMTTYPNDPFYQSGAQGYLDAVNVPAVWDSSSGEGQLIAIIDTGVDWYHPDLVENIWINEDEIAGNGQDNDGNGFRDDIHGWDFVNNDNNPNDDNSHGTHVAGIAAASTNNAIGIAGIAPGAKIMPIKVLQSSGRGNTSDLAAGINYAVQNGATVINMSLGTYGESFTVKTALENAYAYAVLVAAAGNDGYKVDPPYPPHPPYAPMYPACYGFVLGVEASTQTNSLAGFSNYDPTGPVDIGNAYGHNYEVRAPGVGIYSTFPNGTYRAISGTSMASPIVAGAVALMKSYDPEQSTEELFARLIQSANSGVLDIRNALHYELEPDLVFLEYTLVDTLPGCDRDGIADAGETVEIYFTVKNAGGYADSVWATLSFGEFEDTTTAKILKNTSYIGDISAYGTMTGKMDPFIIEIDPGVVNNRDIVFEYEISATNHNSFSGELVATVQKGIELSGVYENLLHLTPDKYYIITGNTVFDSLIIEPGTILRINPSVGIWFIDYLYAEGKPDSMIIFTNNDVGLWERISIDGKTSVKFKYCIFEYSSHGFEGYNVTFEDCIFRSYNRFHLINWWFGCSILRSIIIENNCEYLLQGWGGQFEHNVVVNNNSGSKAALSESDGLSNVKNNTLFNNIQHDIQKAYSIATTSTGWDIYHIPPNYFGTIDSIEIANMILDFFEDNRRPLLLGDNALESPSSFCHGHVWKIEVDNILVNKYDNPYNSSAGLGIVGEETLEFNVYFNRAMDTTYTPFLTFGVREPYTQNIVTDNASWSADSSVWTAYYTVGLKTGDGIQRIRVANARDDERFEIPIEDSRFEFVIQAAGAASIDFIAEAGIGKVNLEWPAAPLEDALGYNMYRSMRVNDSTWTDSIRLNSTLITDTLYTDFSVIPDTTYRYFYTILGTDMSESDPSKKVISRPFSAANGDANGDLAVNVLDIISIVSYMLEEDPAPFLFDAADLNGDGVINVLDIISIVSIINSEGKLAKGTRIQDGEAIFSLTDNKLKASSTCPIGGYQFTLRGDVDNVNLSSHYPMEIVSRKVNDYEMQVLVYSLTGKQIPVGNSEILTLSTDQKVVIEDLVVSGPKGELIMSRIGTGDELLIPDKFELGQNYPNPFNHSTTIEYSLPEISDVKVVIYNILGQEIHRLELNNQRAGYYQYTWNGRNNLGQTVSSGVYLYQMRAKGFTDTKKLVMMK